MAGTQDRKLMTVEEAKLRVLELGIPKETSTGLFSSPLFRSAVLLLGGAFLSRVIRGRGKDGKATPIRDIIMQTLTATGPLLIDQFMKKMNIQASSTAAKSESPANL